MALLRLARSTVLIALHAGLRSFLDLLQRSRPFDEVNEPSYPLRKTYIEWIRAIRHPLIVHLTVCSRLHDHEAGEAVNAVPLSCESVVGPINFQEHALVSQSSTDFIYHLVPSRLSFNAVWTGWRVEVYDEELVSTFI